MQPFGSDRVRPAPDGARIVLSSRYPKGWQARVEKTLTSSEHPGTAVLWDEQWYEVVSAEPLPAGAVRYTLEPWRDEHAMRVTDRYDAESEQQREQAWRAAVTREQKRKVLTFTGVLAGYLPAHVQEELASEYGVPALRMTNLSMLLSIVIVGLTVFIAVGLVMDQGGSPPLGAIFLVLYLLADTGVRYFIAGTQGRPIASSFGFLLYLATHGNKAFHTPKGHSLYIREEPADSALRDAFTLREPLVTLLSPAEQARVAQRFDYDYRRHSGSIAWMLLVFSAIGAFTSFRSLHAHASVSALLSLLCAGGIAIEQVIRLATFPTKPAGSMLGIVARPFVRKLL